MSLKRLPPGTVKLISSTQVITGVSAAVKELIENSIDAGANSIDVKLDNYGFDKIEVKDDGCGISKVDIEFMCQKSFTSKISDFTDLERLHWYGFRGEALNSLCAVGQVTVTTITQSEQIATSYKMDTNGIITDSKPSHINKGTIISVEGLFKKLPVRKQFLSSGRRKSDEMRKVEAVIKSLAVIHPGLRLTFTHNKFIIWQKNKVKDLVQSLIQAVPPTVVRQLVTVAYHSPDNEVHIEVLLPKKDCNIPVACFSSAQDALMLYVNLRPVRHKALEKIIQEEIFVYFGHYIPSGKHPFCLVSVQIPPNCLDVNLEPNKTKVLIKDLDSLTDKLKQLFLCYYTGAKPSDEKSEEVLDVGLLKRKLDTDDRSEEGKVKVPKNDAGSADADTSCDEVEPVVEEVELIVPCLVAQEGCDTTVKESSHNSLFAEKNDISDVPFCSTQKSEEATSDYLDELEMEFGGISGIPVSKCPEESDPDPLSAPQEGPPEKGPPEVSPEENICSELSEYEFASITQKADTVISNPEPSSAPQEGPPRVSPSGLCSELSEYEFASITQKADTVISDPEPFSLQQEGPPEISPVDNIHSELSHEFANITQKADTINTTDLSRDTMVPSEEQSVDVKANRQQVILSFLDGLDAPHKPAVNTDAPSEPEYKPLFPVFKPENNDHVEDDLDTENISLSQWSKGQVKDRSDNIVKSSVKIINDLGGLSNETPLSPFGERSISSQMGRKEMSAFSKFAKEMRTKIIQQAPGISFTKVASELASRWRELEESQKNKYEILAKKEKEEKLSLRQSELAPSTSKPPACKTGKPEGKNRLKKIDYHKVDYISIGMQSLEDMLNKRNDSDVHQAIKIFGKIDDDKRCSCDKYGYYIVSNKRLNEAVSFFKNMSTMALPLKVLDKNIKIEKSSLDENEWHLLESLETSMDLKTNSIVITNEVIVKNGFRIEVLHGEEKTFQITDVPANISYYGIEDLKEILKIMMEKGIHCELEKCRPLKATSFIRSETIRSISSSVSMFDENDNISSRLRFWKEKIHPLFPDCPHNKPVIHILQTV